MLFWLSSTGVGANGFFDRALQRFVAERGTKFLLYNSEQSGYAEKVAEFKNRYPDIKVMRYFNSQRIPEGTRVASTPFSSIISQPAWMLRTRDGTSKILGSSPRRTLWVDHTNEEFQNWYVSHLVSEMIASGTDGLIGDSSHLELIPSTPYDYPNMGDGAVKAAAWADAVVRFYEKIRVAIDSIRPGMILGANGLWNKLYDGMASVQSRLLGPCDFMSVESFGFDGLGVNPMTGPAVFQKFVVELNAIINANPTKLIMVRGTSGDVFFDYRADLQNARYTYACFLMGGKTPSSFFQYAQNFQMTRLPRARANTLAVHSYLELPIGVPVGVATIDVTGGYSREFEGAQVFLSPTGTGLHLWTAPFTGFTTTGAIYRSGDTIPVPDGDAVFLMKSRPAEPVSPLVIDLSDSTTEWLVQNITGEHAYQIVELEVQSTDVNSRVSLRIETDDNPHPFMVLDVLPVGGASAGTSDIPYLQSTTLGAFHAVAPDRYPINNSPAKIQVNLPAVFGARPAYRVISARATGMVTLKSLSLISPQPIIPPVDPGQPIAYFTAARDPANLLKIDFANGSVDNDGTIVSTLYEFGDGATSNLQNPSHVYATAGGKQARITIVDNQGKTSTYSKTVFPAIDYDGPRQVFIPTSLADWNAMTATVRAPDSLYRFDMPSGNALDRIGTLHLVNNLVTLYQQPVGVAGWSKLGVRFAQVVNQRLAVGSGAGPNPATTPSLLVLLSSIFMPSATCGIMSLGANNNIRHAAASGKIRHVVGSPGATQDSAAVYNGDVYLIGLLNDPILNIGNCETDVCTPSPFSGSPYVDPSDANKGIGGVSPTTSYEGTAIWAAWWYTGTLPTFNEVALALNMIDAPEE